MNKKRKLFLISNMYPTNHFPHYGVFVKNFQSIIDESENYVVSQTSLIKGKSFNVFSKVLKYFIFTFNIIIKGIFKSYDIIYVHYFKYSVLPSYLLKKIFTNKILIYNFHGSDLIKDNEDDFNLSRFKRIVLLNCNAIVVPSNYYKNLIENKLNLQSDKLFVSPSGGVNETIFFPKKEFKFEGKIVLGYIGRLDIKKGVDVFIEALNNLKSNGFDFQSYIIGSGTQLEVYKEMITNYGLDTRVKIIEPKPQKELQKYFSIFDLFIFPTYRKSESLGLVGLESLSCGTPVIGTRIGEIQNYIKDGENGFLFEPGDHKMLSDKIMKYMKLDKQSKLNMRKRAIESSRDYNSDIVKINLIEFLNQFF